MPLRRQPPQKQGTIREGYGEYLTGKRIEKGLTIKKLSEMSGVPERNIQNIETEKVEGYSLHHLRQHLKALDIPMSEIFKMMMEEQP